MTIMVPFEADGVEIIDSIPANESQTARRLYEHIKDLRYDSRTMQCDVSRHVIATAADFHSLLAELAEKAEKEDRRPLIHIESHGNTDGLGLASAEFIPWGEIQPALLRLNKATRNHLFVVVAACRGFHAIKAMLDKIDHGTSFRLLAGPAEVTLSGNIEDAMRDFYRSLLTTGSIPAAVESALNSEPTFRIYSAEEAFLKGWSRAAADYPKTNSAIQKRADEIVSQVKASEESAPPDKLHSRAKAAIRSLDLSVPFESFKRKFFMLDSFPEVTEEIKGVTFSS